MAWTPQVLNESDQQMLAYAPGTRAVVRDKEWLIRSVDPSADGDYLLTCDGVSDLVRGHEARIPSSPETDVQILDSENTEPIVAQSQRYFVAFH